MINDKNSNEMLFFAINFVEWLVWNVDALKDILQRRLFYFLKKLSMNFVREKTNLLTFVNL